MSADIPLQSSVPSSSGYNSAGLGISANGDTIAAHIAAGSPQVREDSQVHVFKRGTNGVYSKVAELIAGPWSNGAVYGYTIAVSGDGARIMMTVGDFRGFRQGYRSARGTPVSRGADCRWRLRLPIVGFMETGKHGQAELPR